MRKLNTSISNNKDTVLKSFWRDNAHFADLLMPLFLTENKFYPPIILLKWIPNLRQQFTLKIISNPYDAAATL